MSSDLRERVIIAAKQSFSLFGYKATTMEQVARFASVGKGTIYTFFDSKEQLFHHIIALLTEEMLTPLRAAETLDAALFERLQQGLAGLLRLRQEQELFVKLAQEAQQYGTLEVKTGLEQVEHAIVRYIANLIEHAKLQGEVMTERPELIAFLVYKTVTALVVEWEQAHDPLPDAEISEIFRRMFATWLESSQGREP